MHLGPKTGREDNMNWVSSCMPVIPAFWTQKQKVPRFNISFSYKPSSRLTCVIGDADSQRNKQETHMHTETETDRDSERQTDTETYRQTDTKRDTETDKHNTHTHTQRARTHTRTVMLFLVVNLAASET